MIRAGLIAVLLVLHLLTVPSGSAAQGCDLDQTFRAAGLIDVHSVDPSVRVDLVNADPSKNFFRRDFYHGLRTAYLRPVVARRLARAQNLLRSIRPGLSLQIMDAARPRSVSAAMYATMKGTRFEKYVANPIRGSMHNYGIAVDVTIVDADGNEIDMGFSPFYTSDLGLYARFALFTILGLSDAQRTNRALLADVMQRAGFRPLAHEWWHFDGMSTAEARNRFSIIE